MIGTKNNCTKRPELKKKDNKIQKYQKLMIQTISGTKNQRYQLSMLPKIIGANDQ